MIYLRLSTEFGRLLFFTNVSLMEFQVKYLALICFFSNRRFRIVLHAASSQEYPVNTGVPQGYILVPTLFLLFIKNLPNDVIYNIAICADNTTPYPKNMIRHLICGNN